MASFESIGTCSLDVDITASECDSVTVDEHSGSQNTLVSVSIDYCSTQTPDHHNFSRPPQLQSPNYVQRTARLFDEQLKVNSATSELYYEARKPSYLNLACSVSGYNSLTQYDSKLREGLRSRDNSPARFAFSYGKSTEVSPPAPAGLVSPSKIRELKDQLVVAAAKQASESSANENGKSETVVEIDSGEKQSKNLSNGSCNYSNGSHFPRDRSFENSKTYGMPPSSQIVIETSDWIKAEQKKKINQSTCEEIIKQSIVQQRLQHYTSEVQSNSRVFIENVSHVSLLETTNGVELPVLRHLRQEFRRQLPMIRRSSVGQKTDQISSDSPDCSISRDFIDISENNLSMGKQFSKMCSTDNDVGVQNGESHNDIKVWDIQSCGMDGDVPQPVVEGELTTTHNKDGNDFLQILEENQNSILKLCQRAEDDLTREEMPEESADKVRVAIGKGRLLVNQKMKQFEGLCQRNIHHDVGDTFPTTIEDLEGFWDMVSLQVQDIHNLFQEVDTLRQNKWREVKITASKTAPKKRMPVRNTIKPISAQPSAAAKSRDEARRKMMEEKRKAMKCKGSQDVTETGVEIFVPLSKD